MGPPLDMVRRGGQLSLPTVIFLALSDWPDSRFARSLQQHVRRAEEHIAKSNAGQPLE